MAVGTGPGRGGPRVIVIGGGPSPEHDVSLASARALSGALERGGYRPRLLIAGRDAAFARADGTPLSLSTVVRTVQAADAVIPALHGAWGEDGTLAGFLEVLGVPYAGSGVEASAIAMNKDAAKRVLSSHGLPVAPGITVPGAGRAGQDGQPGRGQAGPGLPPGQRVPFPCIVKPTHAGSSIGITRVAGPDELPAALTAALACGHGALIEPVIEGREVDVALLELPDGEVVAGPPLEISVTGTSSFFDYSAKYEGGVRFDVPAPIGAEMSRRLRRAALRAFEALGCAGLARVDFFIRPGGEVVLNEVNTFPGMSEHSQFPRIFAAEGYSFERLAAILVSTALARAGR